MSKLTYPHLIHRLVHSLERVTKTETARKLTQVGKLVVHLYTAPTNTTTVLLKSKVSYSGGVDD